MFCDLTYDLFWKMFHVHFRKTCIMMFCGGIVYICLLGYLVQGIVHIQCSCIDFLPGYIVENGILKSPTIVVLLSIFPSDLYLFSIFRDFNIECICIYICYIFWMNWPNYHYIMTSWSLAMVFDFCFVWFKYSYTRSLLVSICMEYLFPSLYF